MAMLWAELLILQTMIGYCFVIANTCIGLYNIKDLNNMKGDLVIVKWHKRIGWIETFLFYIITIQCIWMAIDMWDFIEDSIYPINNNRSVHALIGGVAATIIFSFKFIVARYKKDMIYQYGKYIGPLGFIGWSLGHWTSMINFYSKEYLAVEFPLIPSDFIFAAIIPIPIGFCIFLMVLLQRGTKQKGSKWSAHQIAFILHGITFGYEKAAKELLGTPAMFKYVVPKTYKFLEKMMEDVIGVKLADLKGMNVNDALTKFSNYAKKIGMAEKIKIDWNSDSELSVESINCSTAKVRSVMKPEELENAICPWAIMAAAIVNESTGKDLMIEPTSFNKIGAKTKIILK